MPLDLAHKEESNPMESSVESLSNLPVNGSKSPRRLTSVSGTASDAERVETLSLSSSKTVDDIERVESRTISVSKTADDTELTPITIPIFDLMIELFNLHQDNNWPRKALFDAVQRLLGGRIERFFAFPRG
jgi:hypothetical protein